ncbi:hypothetical protein JOC83_003647 [Bacillus iocasae]|uniref:Uncharacterized protein n=1 Tax=Priestia iocasae TaxID=2291674 RepID=A0ABS2QZ73_9BACI|nr:hypothetical protein [Metabacillus iocasae]
MVSSSDHVEKTEKRRRNSIHRKKAWDIPSFLF